MEVLKVCALSHDIQKLDHGDLTLVGERGVSLSGGQKARVNLARAIYSDADIYLLDDPLSAVDAHVGKHLFEECIKNYLKDKVVILVTHQIQYLKEADEILVLKNGEIMHKGDFESVMKSCDDISSFLTEEKEEEEEENGDKNDNMDLMNDSNETENNANEKSNLLPSTAQVLKKFTQGLLDLVTLSRV